MYGQFVDAAITGHVNLGSTITPKVNLMLKHVWWQMENIEGGGVGNKMEDWVEKQHQAGKQERICFCTVNNLQHHAKARAWVIHPNSDPVVISKMLEVDGASKRKFTGGRSKKEGIEKLREMERHAKRLKTLNESCIITKKEEQKSLTLLRILSLANDTKAKPEGSTISRVGGGGQIGEPITKSPLRPNAFPLRN